MSQASYVISEAMRLLDAEHKWSPKGPGTARLSTDEGCRCLLIAIQHGVRRLKMQIEDYQAAYAIVKKLTGVHLAQWNDTHGRTYPEVIGLLTKAKEVADAA